MYGLMWKRLAAALGISLLCATAHGAGMLPDFSESSTYIGIHTSSENMVVQGSGGSNGSDERSTFGRIHGDGSGLLGGSGPGIGAVTTPMVIGVPTSSIADFTGNIALTNSGSKFDFSNTDIYSGMGGGFFCANNNCREGQSNTSYRNPDGTNPDTTSPFGQHITPIGNGAGNNGVNEGVDHTALNNEISQFRTFVADTIANDTFTATLDLTSTGGQISEFSSTGGQGMDFVLNNSHLTGGTINPNGLNVIEVKTGGNDFLINNSNFIVDAGPDARFIFILEEGNMLVTNSRILASQNLGLNNIMFAVLRNNNNDTHFDFSQSEVMGAAFWDLSAEGTIGMNNLRGCGQWMAPNLQNWNNVSVSRCAFQAPAPVPLPAAVWFFLTALSGLGGAKFLQRRKARLDV